MVRILLASWTLIERTGAELFQVELALALKRAGDTPLVWAANLGPLAQTLRRAGITVTDRLSDIEAPEIIQAQNQPALTEALLRFPGVPAISVTHDAVSPLDEPLLHPQIACYVAVDRRCLARLQAAGAAPAEVIFNAVDLERFQPRPPLPRRPGRALVFSNYAHDGADLAAIRSACATNGIALDVVGKGVGRPVSAPEAILGAYDLVFAKARAALEAMATGCAVVLCDFAGLGEMVTAERFDHLRDWNFGAGVLERPITEAGLLAEIARYDAPDAAEVSRLTREEAGLDEALLKWRALHAEILAEPRRASTAEDHRRLLRARSRWRGLRRVDWLRTRLGGWRTSLPYRSGRALWRAIGSPGESRS
jgi:hypothetical protein